MPTHFDRYKSSHNAEDLFNMVADVSKYPEFIPWISNARIFNQQENIFLADLVVSFKALSHSYTSEVKLEKPCDINANYEISVTSIKGPFKKLNTHWIFRPIDNNHTEVIFEIDFQFKSLILEKMIGKLFDTATKKMTKAFQDRAKQLYG